MAKILIVDDDSETTTLLSAIVSSLGHEPISVNQSWRALATAKAEKPALALRDIMMAEINGIDLCKLIKADPDLSEIPVINFGHKYILSKILTYFCGFLIVPSFLLTLDSVSLNRSI